MSDVLLLALLAINAVTFVAFGLDKWSAVRGRRRVPELHLLGLCAAGGLAGGLLAMAAFRHKTRKGSFRWRLALAGALCAAWLGLWLGTG